MSGLFSGMLDRILGGGAHAVTTPPMDGALLPNQAIEQCQLLLTIAQPDNLVRRASDILFSSGRELRRLDPGQGSALVTAFDADICALAVSPNATLAAALLDGRVLISGGSHDPVVIAAVEERPTLCPTALHFEDDETLLVCLGSSRNAPDAWKRDLMQRGASGSVWRLRIADGSASCLADNLAYPNGILTARDGTVIVSESWRSRLVRILPGQKVEPVLSNLPGYPARIAARTDTDGAWLTVFAPRSQLVEFVLRERDYCDEMLRDVPEHLWIAPALAAPRSFLEPLQGGALKQLGILKPWAPTRSFGLVLSLDAEYLPVESWHSRSDGTRHGITSCIEDGSNLVVASRGGDALLSLPVAPAEDVRR